MFETHRVFCATPWELEAERRRFHDLVGNFNEAVAMQQGILFVPVTLTNIRDKRPLQYVVDENILDSRHYILLLSDNWGPAERNFRRDYQLALKALADPASPMLSVAVLAGSRSSGEPPAADMPEPHAAFSTMAEFDDCIRGLLVGWLESLSAHQVPARAAAG